jgi:cation:H+ antiporter
MLIFLVGKRIFRLHGGILLFYYGAYMAFLILRATRHEALQLFSTVFVQIVLPVTLLLILLPAARRLSRPGK